MTEPVLHGRSSSHFTRVARIFALELGVAHSFRPVLDIMSQDATSFAGNPALKVPTWVDESGPLFGSENICRAVAQRSDKSLRVVLKGACSDRSVQNAEELIVSAMGSEVTLITAKVAGTAAPEKVLRSIENTLDHLEQQLETVLARLPPDRTLSFLEVALFCLVTHLPFRQIMEVARWPRLVAFADRFGERPSALNTAYRFD